jgi:DNA-binding NarL/FixJ family response regulator
MPLLTVITYADGLLEGHAPTYEKGVRCMGPAISSPTVTMPATILIIDDNEEDLKHWSDLLRRSSANYTVLESSSASAGLDLYRAHTVDCVVLDLDMPESGFHALLELVPDRHRPQVAVIVLTHLPHPNLFEMAKHNGAQACLLKQSTSVQDLDHAIQEAMAAVKSTRPAG